MDSAQETRDRLRNQQVTLENAFDSAITIANDQASDADGETVVKIGNDRSLDPLFGFVSSFGLYNYDHPAFATQFLLKYWSDVGP